MGVSCQLDDPAAVRPVKELAVRVEQKAVWAPESV